MKNIASTLSAIPASAGRTEREPVEDRPGYTTMQFRNCPSRKVEDFRLPGSREDPMPTNGYYLGFPWALKQEEFMYRLQPYLKQGVAFGFGAIFSFNAGRACKAGAEDHAEAAFRNGCTIAMKSRRRTHSLLGFAKQLPSW